MMIFGSRGSMQAFEQLRWVCRRLDLTDREPLPSGARQVLLAVTANRIVATALVVLIAG